MYMAFSPPKDTQKLSLEDEKKSYLNAQASSVLVYALSNVYISQLMPFGMLMSCGQSFKINMVCPRFVGMIFLPPPPVAMHSQLLLLHQHVVFHKVMKW